MVCVGTLGLFSKGKIEPSSVVCVWEGGGRGGEGRRGVGAIKWNGLDYH